MYNIDSAICIVRFFVYKNYFLFSSIQREMLTRCVNFAIHLKKQTLKDSVPGTSTKDLHDLKDMVIIFYV